MAERRYRDLTPDEVLEVLEVLRHGEFSIRSLAKKYNIGLGTMRILIAICDEDVNYDGH